MGSSPSQWRRPVGRSLKGHITVYWRKMEQQNLPGGSTGGWCSIPKAPSDTLPPASPSPKVSPPSTNSSASWGTSEHRSLLGMCVIVTTTLEVSLECDFFSFCDISSHFLCFWVAQAIGFDQFVAGEVPLRASKPLRSLRIPFSLGALQLWRLSGWMIMWWEKPTVSHWNYVK